MRYHVDFFRSRLKVSLGHEPLGSQMLVAWVASPFANLIVPVSGGCPITLTSLQSLLPLYAFEVARFADAALESFVTCRSKWSHPLDRDGLAWQLVALYYASYYASHAVLRLMGTSVTQIENWTSIQNAFDVLYKTPQIPKLNLEKGYHFVSVDAGGRSVNIEKAATSSKNGSHAVVWSKFKEFADLAYSNNALNTSQQQAAVIEYTKISTALIIPGGSVQWPWMSSVRNQINYRLPENVWGPFSKRIQPGVSKKIHQLLQNPTSAAISAAAADPDPLVRFVGSCVFTISVLCSLLREMELRSASRSYLPRIYKERAGILKIFG